MSARRKARKRALDLLYAADVRSVPIDVMVESEAAHADPRRSGSWEYACEICLGVAEHSADIDAAILEHAHGWTIDRMPAIDRALLRIAVWEILFNPTVPAAVAIAEAVELAGALSTDESAGFVNGVLASIHKERANASPAP